MSNVPGDRKYTRDHEWAKAEGQVIKVGITDYAQGHLGDVVMVELPRVGQVVAAHKTFGTVESPKSVSDLFSPVSGTVTAVNDALDASPEKVNADCYGEGWICAITVADSSEYDGLMDAAAYEALIASLDA